MAFGMVASVVGIGAGLNSLFGGGSSQGGSQGGPGYTPQQAQQIADPFADQRAKYGKMLQDFMLGTKGTPAKAATPGHGAIAGTPGTKPMDVSALPGYQAQLAQGEQAVSRTMAAHGQAQSGAEQTALFDYGQSQQSQFADKYLQQLMNLSGANQNPAAGFTAGQDAWQGNVNQAQQGLQNQSNILGGVSRNFGNLSRTFGPVNNDTYANSLSTQPSGGGYSDPSYSQGGWFGS